MTCTLKGNGHPNQRIICAMLANFEKNTCDTPLAVFNFLSIPNTSDHVDALCIPQESIVCVSVLFIFIWGVFFKYFFQKVVLMQLHSRLTCLMSTANGELARITVPCVGSLRLIKGRSAKHTSTLQVLWLLSIFFVDQRSGILNVVTLSLTKTVGTTVYVTQCGYRSYCNRKTSCMFYFILFYFILFYLHLIFCLF